MQDGTYLVKADGSIVNYGERWGYGYFVADGELGRVIRPDDTLMGLGDEGLLRVVSAQDGANLVGVWTNPETGIIYIDPVDHVSDRESAIKLGTERGELAIWDARDNVAITL